MTRFLMNLFCLTGLRFCVAFEALGKRQYTSSDIHTVLKDIVGKSDEELSSKPFCQGLWAGTRGGYLYAVFVLWAETPNCGVLCPLLWMIETRHWDLCKMHCSLTGDLREPPGYILPKIALLLAVMEHCGIAEVHFCSTIGSCPGLLISDTFFGWDLLKRWVPLNLTRANLKKCVGWHADMTIWFCAFVRGYVWWWRWGQFNEEWSDFMHAVLPLVYTYTEARSKMISVLARQLERLRVLCTKSQLGDEMVVLSLTFDIIWHHYILVYVFITI